MGEAWAVGFEWDEGNLKKVMGRMHPALAELAFRGNPTIALDSLHSIQEKRWFLVNRVQDKFIFLIYTKRGNRIRIISARFMHNKEVQKYEEWFKTQEA